MGHTRVDAAVAASITVNVQLQFLHQASLRFESLRTLCSVSQFPIPDFRCSYTSAPARPRQRLTIAAD